MMNRYRVGIYLRLSDEDRDKVSKLDDSESIKNQRNLLIEEINKRDDFVLVDEYCDEDLSGAGTYRPQFERLIRDCENGLIDVVLCKSQSRFSRDMEIIEKYLHNKFIEWNVRFISLADYADTFNLGNKKARQINGLVNEWYLEDLSNNIRSAFYIKMKKGEYISPFAPFGYYVNNNKLVVDKIAAFVVKKIFLLYCMGYGYEAISTYLNDRKIPSPSYYKFLNGCKLHINSKLDRKDILWNTSSVRSILSNEVYIGNLIQGKRTTVSYKNHKTRIKAQEDWIRSYHTHEAIIDDDTFYMVQMIKKKRTRVIKKTRKRHIFSGKVYCFNCGKGMRKKNSSRYEYLVCSNYDCFNKCSIRYDILERIILGLINLKLRNYNYLISNDYGVKSLEENISLLIDKKEKINLYIKNLYEDRVNGIIDISLFRDLVLNYQRQRNLYDMEIKSIKKEIICKRNKEKDLKIKSFSRLSRVIINELILGIYCDCKRGIKIIWNF